MRFSNGDTAYVYWDLGGDITQLGHPDAIPRLIEIQGKVNTLSSSAIHCMMAKYSLVSACWGNCLGSLGLLRSSFYPGSLYSNFLLNAMVSCGLLRDPFFVRSLLRHRGSGFFAALQTLIIGLEQTHPWGYPRSVR